MTEFCSVLVYAEAQVGIKAGDWIRCDYVPGPGGALPSDATQWVKVECLSVTGKTATLRMTTYLNSGAEQTEIMTLDVASGTGNLTFQVLILANSKTGDTAKSADRDTIHNISVAVTVVATAVIYTKHKKD